MMASSTSSPMAIASPPRLMLLIVRPKRSIAMTAATSDSGNASSVMTAARTFIRNTTTTRMTRTAPSTKRREEVVERLLDEVGLPEQVAMDLHALRQGALDIVERGVDARGQLQRVHGRLLLDADDDGGLGVVRAFAPLDRRAFANDAHVAHEDWRGVGVLDADRGDGVDVGETADAAHEVLLPLGDLKAGRRVLVGGGQRAARLRRASPGAPQAAPGRGPLRTASARLRWRSPARRQARPAAGGGRRSRRWCGVPAASAGRIRGR